MTLSLSFQKVEQVFDAGRDPLSRHKYGTKKIIYVGLESSFRRQETGKEHLEKIKFIDLQSLLLQCLNIPRSDNFYTIQMIPRYQNVNIKFTVPR